MWDSRTLLGAELAALGLDRDAAIPPNGSFTQADVWGPSTFERLLKLKPDEVGIETCVRAVLFEDGTKEQF